MRIVLVLSALLAGGRLAHAADPTFPSSVGDLMVQTVANGLVHPWSLAFLPDGRMLVTERPGRIRIVGHNGQLSPPLRDVPKVFAVSQGGLLDVILDRGFVQNRTIIFRMRSHSTAAGAPRLRVPGWMTARCRGSLM